MPISPVRLFEISAEYCPMNECTSIPQKTRGLYILYKERAPKKFDVVYVGIASGAKAGMHGRISSHARSKAKSKMWTHFSVFKVWDNIRAEEIKELEGLFRHIYRYDQQANRLNAQKSYKPLKQIRNDKLNTWKRQSTGRE